MTHTEGSIQKLLALRFSNDVRYRLTNAYIFRYDWESDFFMQRNSNGYCFEVEVKVTRADFFADMKKVYKHQILKSGTYTEHVGGTERIREWSFRPNRFYYCVPDGLIKPEEVPSYAGLIYAKECDVYIVKEAPFIHKEKLKMEGTLCRKFYWQWRNTEFEASQLKRRIEYLESKLTEHETTPTRSL